jgi:hypothetical protein
MSSCQIEEITDEEAAVLEQQQQPQTTKQQQPAQQQPEEVAPSKPADKSDGFSTDASVFTHHRARVLMLCPFPHCSHSSFPLVVDAHG